MLKNCTKLIPQIKQLKDVLLHPEPILHQQLRTTFILKRRHQPPLHKLNLRPKRLRVKYYIYDLVKDTNVAKKPDLKLILTQYVDGLGNAGDVVSVPPNYGYNQLLLTGIAVYANPENMELYKDKSSDDVVKHSSPYAQMTAQVLSNKVISVVMSKENPWTIQPWHISTSFRKCGFIVPKDTITLPETPIKGPDTNLQDREFFVTVTVKYFHISLSSFLNDMFQINNFEKVKVKCRIHHWSTDICDRMPHVHEFWKESPGLVFPDNEQPMSIEK
ncbi:hypothetical protein FQR65_LT09153 [Abscondita terminalis]|nr:hypothetical protein FQR65_LT09153 [Abscondita terminalis]